jgi:hypothetical protein
MNFIIFLWNTFARLFWFLWFIIFEIIVFNFIVGIVSDAGMPWLAAILKLVFTIWIIAEIVLKIVVGGGKTLIKWIFRL